MLTVFNITIWITWSVSFISGFISARLGIRIYDEVELMVEKLQAQRSENGLGWTDSTGTRSNCIPAVSLAER